MTFTVLPTLEPMLAIYRIDRSRERFDAYLKLLHGNSNGDLEIPVSGYNPMAKEYAVAKLEELKNIRAEQVAAVVLRELNSVLLPERNRGTIRVALNLTDDLKGGWTNRYSSDYDSKFRIGALVKRGFCVPVFWTSEAFTVSIVRERVFSYAFRTLYWLNRGAPRTLQEHVLQERFVAVGSGDIHSHRGDEILDDFYRRHKDSTDYSLIFNFLYGDAAAESLGYPLNGIKNDRPGLNWIAQNRIDESVENSVNELYSSCVGPISVPARKA